MSEDPEALLPLRLATDGYLALAAAYVRGRLGAIEGERDAEAVARGHAAGLRLHRFKRNAELPRVRRVLGTLHGLAPTSLLDVGSGRGTFLWPLLDELPGVPVTAIERDASRARELAAVAAGGAGMLQAAQADVTQLAFPDDTFDVSTALEVLEHLHDPGAAAAELLRVTRRFIVVTVPSRPDDNPEHLRLFSADDLRRLFEDRGAARVTLSAVHGHHVAVVTVK
ncbi:MAG: class I SAM-dependent methyltransferase [Planctomycetota bacterium]